MGRRGPKPKPTAQRILEGNPGRMPINLAEPEPLGQPVCPAHLSADAKALWARTLASVPPGMISQADEPLLAMFCETAAVHKQAVTRMNEERDLFGDSLVANGRPSPYWRIAQDAARTLATLATRLGLSPADRAGLKVSGKPAEDSKWAGLLA